MRARLTIGADRFRDCIAQQEVFGPALSIIAYDDDDDAVRIANNSDYGFSGAVFSADGKRIGREMGVAGLEELLENNSQPFWTDLLSPGGRWLPLRRSSSNHRVKAPSRVIGAASRTESSNGTRNHSDQDSFSDRPMISFMISVVPP